jgi:hypothetical protein
VAKKSEQTASPARNFTLTTAERVQAIIQGVPAWARRLKRIEDLMGEIAQLHDAGNDRDAKKRLEEMVKLVEAHNAYYPMEANLPFDPDTSRVMDRGEPWRPMPRPTLESILAARRHDDAPTSVAWHDSDGALSVAFGDVTLRIDEEFLACSRGDELVAHVPLWSIEEIAAPPLRVITTATETIELPAPPDIAETICQELAARLRSLRSAKSDYRGD